MFDPESVADRATFRAPTEASAGVRYLVVAGTVVVDDGRIVEGAIAIEKNERISIPSAPVSDVVDTTGAGDLYASGFLYGFTAGLPLARCGELGSLAAAEVISHIGARPEVRLADLA